LIAAETYYRRGLDAAKDPSYRLTASTAYAWFLFAQRRFEEAREEYKTGISNRVGSDNFARYQKGMSYRFWGENERFWAGSSMAAQQAFESAASEFRGIDLAEFRNNVLRDLENIRSATAAPPSEPKGGVAA
jgi:hypothetical protein